MIYYFSVADKHLDYYRWGIEGDKDLAEQYLQSFSKDVRFIEEKKEDPYAKANKVLPNGLIIRQCLFSKQLRSKKSEGFNDKYLPLDSRQTRFGEEESLSTS